MWFSSRLKVLRFEKLFNILSCQKVRFLKRRFSHKIVHVPWNFCKIFETCILNFSSFIKNLAYMHRKTFLFSLIGDTITSWQTLSWAKQISFKNMTKFVQKLTFRKNVAKQNNPWNILASRYNFCKTAPGKTFPEKFFQGIHSLHDTIICINFARIGKNTAVPRAWAELVVGYVDYPPCIKIGYGEPTLAQSRKRSYSLARSPRVSFSVMIFNSDRPSKL